MAPIERELYEGHLKAWRDERMREEAATVDREAVLLEGIQQGEKRALLASLAMLLEVKFGDAGKSVRERLSQVNDPEQLLSFQKALLFANTLDELQPLLPRQE